MTTTIIYGADTDDHIRSSNGVYATARAGSSLVQQSSGFEYLIVGQEASDQHYLYESFSGFDTSAIPDTDVILSALLEMWLASDQSGTDFTVEARVYDWGAGVTTADWVPGANLAALTRVATRATAGIGGTGSYKSFTEDGTNFQNAINKTGFTRLILVSDKLVAGNAAAGTEYVLFASANMAGTTQDPRLTITHEVPPSRSHQMIL